MSNAAEARRNDTTATTGLALAACVVAAFVVVQVAAVGFHDWTPSAWITAPLIVALLTWLYVGLFIVAHDCMHGSLAPGRPRLNRVIGQLCTMLYAGFDFDALRDKHHRHHRASGTPDDPDFDPRDPHTFWPWYLRFMSRYMSPRQPVFFTVVGAVYLLMGAAPLNVAVFLALPALASSAQLFYFGTYLPHRTQGEAFVDHHRARSSPYGWLVSLLTCYHFGYHHEHHASPATPWWRLPRMRANRVPLAP